MARIVRMLGESRRSDKGMHMKMHVAQLFRIQRGYPSEERYRRLIAPLIVSSASIEKAGSFSHRSVRKRLPFILQSYLEELSSKSRKRAIEHCGGALRKETALMQPRHSNEMASLIPLFHIAHLN